VGADTALQWPVGIGAKGNEGVANMAKQTDGAIGYVEFAYAKQNNMTYTQLVNKAGKTVQPSLDSFSAAAAGADWANTPGFNLVLTNQAAPDAWPIVGASFIIVYKRPRSAGAAHGPQVLRLGLQERRRYGQAARLSSRFPRMSSRSSRSPGPTTSRAAVAARCGSDRPIAFAIAWNSDGPPVAAHP
jgi:ABC-type phosphate transport system, periplasmic component